MLQNVISGKYLLGALIVPKKYTKYVVDKQGKISESEYTVQCSKSEEIIIVEGGLLSITSLNQC